MGRDSITTYGLGPIAWFSTENLRNNSWWKEVHTKLTLKKKENFYLTYLS